MLVKNKQTFLFCSESIKVSFHLLIHFHVTEGYIIYADEWDQSVLN